jgi:aspartate racemase
MRTLGLIGGLSWQSSIEYYRILNELTAGKLGGHHSCPCILYSLDLEPVLRHQQRDEWPALTDMLVEAAGRLQRAGAGLVLICANTMHRTADAVEAKSGVPLLHIVDATAAALGEAGVSRVGLLGTLYTMEQEFYRERLQKNFAVETLIPAPEDRRFIHNVIHHELDYGILNHDSRRRFLAIIDRLARKGAEGVILGCTEIPLLLRDAEAAVPLFDTTRIHAQAGVSWVLSSA